MTHKCVYLTLAHIILCDETDTLERRPHTRVHDKLGEVLRKRRARFLTSAVDTLNMARGLRGCLPVAIDGLILREQQGVSEYQMRMFL
jgi:hypothetical protein